MHPIHCFPPYFPRIHSNIILLCTRRFSELSLPFTFSDQYFVRKYCLSSPVRVTCPVHLMLLDLVTLIIFGEAYKLRSSTLCSVLQPPETCSLSGLSIPSAPCSQTSSVYVFPLVWETKFHTRTKQQVKLVLREETGRQNILNWMVASIPLIYSCMQFCFVTIGNRLAVGDERVISGSWYGHIDPKCGSDQIIETNAYLTVHIETTNKPSVYCKSFGDKTY
jgi:hypothetical protein